MTLNEILAEIDRQSVVFRTVILDGDDAKTLAAAAREAATMLRDFIEWGAMTGSDRDLFTNRFRDFLFANGVPKCPACDGRGFTLPNPSECESCSGTGIDAAAGREGRDK